MPSKYLFGNFHRLLPQFPPILLWGDSLPDPVETERLRSLVTHVGSMDSLGLFNAVAAVLQKPNATAVLPENQWRRFGLEPKPDAFPIAIASMKGPIDFAYDISDTQPLALPNKKAWEVSVDKLHGPRYWCGKIRAWESASKVMKKFEVEIDVQPTWETLLNEKAIGYAVHVEAGQ